VDVSDPHPARALQVPPHPNLRRGEREPGICCVDGDVRPPGRRRARRGRHPHLRGYLAARVQTSEVNVWRRARRSSAVSPRAPRRFVPHNARKKILKLQGQDQERTQHSATPNSHFRSVGVLYVSVVSPEYSVFSGLTTETIILLEDRSIGRVLRDSDPCVVKKMALWSAGPKCGNFFHAAESGRRWDEMEGRYQCAVLAPYKSGHLNCRMVIFLRHRGLSPVVEAQPHHLQSVFFRTFSFGQNVQNPVGLEALIFLDATKIDWHSWSRRVAKNLVPTSNHAHGARNGGRRSGVRAMTHWRDISTNT